MCWIHPCDRHTCVRPDFRDFWKLSHRLDRWREPQFLPRLIQPRRGLHSTSNQILKKTEAVRLHTALQFYIYHLVHHDNHLHWKLLTDSPQCCDQQLGWDLCVYSLPPHYIGTEKARIWSQNGLPLSKLCLKHPIGPFHFLSKVYYYLQAIKWNWIDC